MTRRRHHTKPNAGELNRLTPSLNLESMTLVLVSNKPGARHRLDHAHNLAANTAGPSRSGDQRPPSQRPIWRQRRRVEPPAAQVSSQGTNAIKASSGRHSSRQQVWRPVKGGFDCIQ